MISRRDLLKLTGVAGVGSTALSGYALAETLREEVTQYRLTPPRWTPGLQVRLAVLADLHVCGPWMGIERLEEIVAQTNELRPDAILLLGDYVAGKGIAKFSTHIGADSWAKVLAGLKAPLGVHAVLGNHDFWEDHEVQVSRQGLPRAGVALEAAGIPVYENAAIKLTKGGRDFWLVGLGDQCALSVRPGDSLDAMRHAGWTGYLGRDDLPAALAQVTDDAPVVLMAHEPDIFPNVPDRVSLTLAGHTHGGQIRIFGYVPYVPSRFGSRYLYGHKIEDGRHLIVSGGLGCSSLPLRIGAPPEIVVIDLGAGGEA